MLSKSVNRGWFFGTVGVLATLLFSKVFCFVIFATFLFSVSESENAEIVIMFLENNLIIKSTVFCSLLIIL